MSAVFLSYFAIAISLIGQSEELKPKNFDPRLVVTYLANEGVQLAFGGKTVIIDALFREGVSGYAHVEPSTLGKLEQAQPPFDKVRLVLVTHRHGDHFDRESVARHLANNPKAVLVTSAQVTKSVHQAMLDTGPMADRIRAVVPAADGRVATTVDGIKVDVLRLSHGGGRFANVVNFGYVVHLGGQRVLHLGDAHLNDATRGPLEKHARGVDIACIPYWWLMNADGRGYVLDTLKPKHVIAFHVPPKEGEAVSKLLRSTMPNAWTMTELMESRDY